MSRGVYQNNSVVSQSLGSSYDKGTHLDLFKAMNSEMSDFSSSAISSSFVTTLGIWLFFL